MLHLLRSCVTIVATKNNYILTIYDFYHKKKSFSQLILRYKNNNNFKQLNIRLLYLTYVFLVTFSYKLTCCNAVTLSTAVFCIQNNLLFKSSPNNLVIYTLSDISELIKCETYLFNKIFSLIKTI